MDKKEQIIEEFFKLKTRQDVARILNIKDESLRYFLYGKKADNMYYERTIQKKIGGERKISIPDKRLRNIQRKLLRILECVYNRKPSAYGFIEGKNNVLNARNHTKKKVILNIDLKDFFSQIHFGRVVGMLKSKPYEIGKEAALVIAQIVCYKGKLPQGAPTSPILSNMICSPLDTQLTMLAKKYKLVYTRYADDITFSSHNNRLPNEIVEIQGDNIFLGEELKQILQKNSFEVNNEKVYLRKCNERQEVTGLVVNKIVNLKRQYIREIRAILDSCKKDGIYGAANKSIDKGLCKNSNIVAKSKLKTKEAEVLINEWFENMLKGKINYIKCVRGENNNYFIKYALEMNRIFDKEIFNLQEHYQFLEKVEKRCYIFESKSPNSIVQGSGFLLKNIGIFTNYHVTKDNDFYTVKTYKDSQICVVSREVNAIVENEIIDYAVYSINSKNDEGWELGDSSKITYDSKLKVIGFPQYSKGDTPYIQECNITNKKSYLGGDIYTVSARIVHGASGGVVVNEKEQVVGIIRCGTENFDETNEDNIIPGFIPINIVIEDMKLQNKI